MESNLARPSLIRQFPDGCGFDVDDFRKPYLKKVLTEERLYGVEKDWTGTMVPKNRVRILTANYNFDVDHLRDVHIRNLQEARAVEGNLSREKSILREAFILRQRRRMEPEVYSKKFN
jgi:hypothetical protein